MNHISKFAKKVNNNKKVYSSLYKEKEVISNVDVNKVINEIFNSKNYIYKADVIITTDEGEVSKRIIGRNSNYLITSENEKIEISKIRNIKKTG